MSPIFSRTVLIHGNLNLPGDLFLDGGSSQEVWNVMNGKDARDLATNLQRWGWQFTVISDWLQKSGVGATSEEAIDCALRQLLCQLDVGFNAVQVESIDLKAYPWFCLARLIIRPGLIQQLALPNISCPPLR